MKKIIRILILLLVVSLFAVTNSMAQVMVRVRPDRPGRVIVRRPFRPSARHVWVSEEWTPAGAAYAYHGGYWAVPPHPRAVWVSGRWNHRPGGYVWIGGHWR